MLSDKGLPSDAPDYLHTVRGLSVRDARLAERCDQTGASAAEERHLARKIAQATARIRYARELAEAFAGEPPPVGNQNSGCGGLARERVVVIAELLRAGHGVRSAARQTGHDRKTIAKVRDRLSAGLLPGV